MRLCVLMRLSLLMRMLVLAHTYPITHAHARSSCSCSCSCSFPSLPRGYPRSLFANPFLFIQSSCHSFSLSLLIPPFLLPSAKPTLFLITSVLLDSSSSISTTTTTSLSATSQTHPRVSITLTYPPSIPCPVFAYITSDPVAYSSSHRPFPCHITHIPPPSSPRPRHHSSLNYTFIRPSSSSCPFSSLPTPSSRRLTSPTGTDHLISLK